VPRTPIIARSRLSKAGCPVGIGDDPVFRVIDRNRRMGRRPALIRPVAPATALRTGLFNQRRQAGVSYWENTAADWPLALDAMPVRHIRDGELFAGNTAGTPL
jgi:hypothetical protein